MQSENVTFSREYECLAKIGIRKRSHQCYWETRSNVKAGQHEPTQTDNQRQKYMEKNLTHLLLLILAVNRQIDLIQVNDCDDICDPK